MSGWRCFDPPDSREARLEEARLEAVGAARRHGYPLAHEESCPCRSDLARHDCSCSPFTLALAVSFNMAEEREAATCVANFARGFEEHWTW